jgi:uncharacterized protein (TIGR02996 family)
MSDARPELLGLLRACKERHEDDGPRLILSDWLDDSEERTLASLVRLQCRATRMTIRERRHQRVEKRIQALQEKCAAFLKPLSQRKLSTAFVRGLLYVGATLHAIRQPEVLNLARTELWAWVESLSVAGQQWGAAGLRSWLTSGLCEEVGILTFSGLKLSNDAAQAFGEATLPRLRELNLYLAPQGATGLRRLGKAPWAGRVAKLAFNAHGHRRGGIGAAGATALADGRWAGLGELCLPYNDVGDSGAEALADASWFGNVRRLDLQSNNLRAAGVRALLQAARGPGLADVVLHSNPLGDEGAGAVASSSWLSATTNLWLSGCEVGDPGAQALAESSGASRLSTLNLSYNRIGDRGALALARSAHLANLTGLSLYHNQITEAGARALTERFGRAVTL